MDREEVRAAYDAQMRRGDGSPGAERRTRRVGGEGWACVVWSDLDAGTADAAVAEQVAWLHGPEGEGTEFEWKLYSHDEPQDLGDRLRRAGFVPEPPETLMVAEVASLPTDVVLPAGVRLEEVTDAAGVDLLAQAHERAFGTNADALRDRLVEQLADTGDGTLMLVVALAGETPVCGARLETHPGKDFAGLWGGGTDPQWRGRGIYRALVAYRARAAAARGIRYLQVDASDDSRPILQRLGFTALSTTTPYIHPGRQR